MNLEAADIVLVGGKSFVSRGIQWGQVSKGEKRVGWNHGAIVTRPLTHEIVSSDWPRVQLKSLYEYADADKYRVAIYRARNIAPRVKVMMAAAAEERVGRRYPVLELGLHFLDNKLFGGRYKARAFGSSTLEVCTEVIGQVYLKYGFAFGVEGGGLAPDDIWRFVNDQDRTYYDCIMRTRET